MSLSRNSFNRLRARKIPAIALIVPLSSIGLGLSNSTYADTVSTSAQFTLDGFPGQTSGGNRPISSVSLNDTEDFPAALPDTFTRVSVAASASAHATASSVSVSSKISINFQLVGWEPPPGGLVSGSGRANSSGTYSGSFVITNPGSAPGARVDLPIFVSLSGGTSTNNPQVSGPEGFVNASLGGRAGFSAGGASVQATLGKTSFESNTAATLSLRARVGDTVTYGLTADSFAYANALFPGQSNGIGSATGALSFSLGAPVVTPFTWRGLGGLGSGQFAVASNWDANEIPDTAATALFNGSGGAAGVSLVQLAADQVGRVHIRNGDVRLTGGSLMVNGLGAATVIGDQAGNSPAQLQLSSALTTAGGVRVGGASAGDLILNDGSNLTVGGTLEVGSAAVPASGGEVLLKAGSTSVAAQVVIGKFGILTAERNIFVGPNPSGQRQLAVTGSLEVTDGGVLATKQTSRIDGTVATPGSVTLSGAGTKWSVSDREIDDPLDVEPDQEQGSGKAFGKLIVGSSGTAVLNVTSGANVFVDTKVIVGSTPASDGSMHFSTGGIGDLGFEFRVGDQGTGAITLASGATAIVTNAAYVGYVNQSHGSITVSDPSSVFSVDSLGAGGAPFLHIGEAGIGTLTVNAGGRVAADAAEVVFGRFGTGKGTGIVTGAGARLDAATLDIAPLGIALLEVKSHGVVSTGDMRIGNGTAAQGRVVVTDGGQLLINNQGLEIGEIHGNSALARLTVSDTGSLVRVNGVTRLHNLGLLDINTGAVLDTGGLIVDFGGRVDGNGGRLVVGAAIDDRGYVNRGLLDPGNSPGTLTIDGDYLQAPEGSLQIQIGGVQPGTEYDVLTVNGNMARDGQLILQFLDGFAPHQGDQFNILQVSGSTAGNFADVVIENLAPGFQYNLSNDGNLFTLTAINDGVFVPEAGTATLYLIGLVLLTARSYRPRRCFQDYDKRLACPSPAYRG